jgi:hypothetical protein
MLAFDIRAECKQVGNPQHIEECNNNLGFSEKMKKLVDTHTHVSELHMWCCNLQKISNNKNINYYDYLFFHVWRSIHSWDEARPRYPYCVTA